MSALLDIQEFFVEGKATDASHVLLHITEPGTKEEMEKGYFFALAEIPNPSIDIVEAVQELIDSIETEYYSTEDGDDKDAFELTLEMINRKHSDMLETRRGGIHILLGTLRNQTLSLAHRGSAHALVFYQSGASLERMSILDGDEPSPSPALFSSVVQGRLNINDIVCFATRGVTDVFSYDRIAKLLGSRTARQSAEHAQRVLHDIGDGLSYAGILITVLPKSAFPKTGKQPLATKQGSAASLNSFLSTQQKTAQTLSPPLLGNMKQTMRSYLGQKKEKAQKEALDEKIHRRGMMETNIRYRETVPKRSYSNTILMMLGRALVSGTIGLVGLLKKFMTIVGRLSIVFIILVSNKNNGRKDMRDKIQAWFDQKMRMLQSLSILSKVFLVSTILFGAIFLGSILFLKIREAGEAKTSAYQTLIRSIEEKKTEAEQRLIFNDQTQALILLQEASAILATLPEENKKQIETKKSLRASIEDTLMTLRKIDRISPNVIVNIKAQFGDADTRGLGGLGSTLVAFGKEDTRFYTIDPTTKQIDEKNGDLLPGIEKADTPKEKDVMVLFGKDNRMAEYRADTSALQITDVSFPNANTSLMDLALYNQRLYTLDPANNQIYRHSKTQTGYDKGTPWIQDASLDIRNASAFAIDGDIYLLKKNGEVLKISKGIREDFSMQGLDPVLEDPGDIWTYNDVNFIYILEAKNKRVIRLTKEGKLVRQYTADVWKAPTGMLVDEAEKTIYVLDDDIVYSFGI